MLLSRALLKTVGSASKDTNRYQLTGVHYKYDKTVVEACATDGKVLTVVRETSMDVSEFPTVDGVSADQDIKADFILPTDACQTLAKAIPKRIARQKPILGHVLVDDATVTDTAKVLTFSEDIRPAVSQHATIDGTFPDYSSLLPSDRPESECQLNLDILIAGLKTLRDVIGEKDQTIKMSLWSAKQPIRFAWKDDTLDVSTFVMPMIKNK